MGDWDWQVPNPARKPPLSPMTGAFGDRVRATREAKGLSQENLAERAGLHWTYIGQVERGQRNLSLHNILKIAGGLSVDAGELVRGLKMTE